MVFRGVCRRLCTDRKPNGITSAKPTVLCNFMSVASLVTLSFPNTMPTCGRLTAALYSLYISDRVQMLKLKAGLPASTRPSLDASPRIVSSLRISDATMSGREMAEERLHGVSNQLRPAKAAPCGIQVLRFGCGGLVIVAFRRHDPTRSMRCQYATLIKPSFSASEGAARH